MPTKNQIEKMLTQVIDPELGKNIVEAGMVRDIQIKDGGVDITLALTMKGCPLKDQLKEQTKAAAEANPRSATHTIRRRFHDPRSSLILRIMPWSPALPGNVQHRTGTPSRVTAIAITTCGRSGRWSLECPNWRTAC